MRQLIIDTETTGLEPKAGHRIIELAAVEIVNRRATGRHLHFYFNPEREIDMGATDVHGKTWEDLKQQPRFRDRMGEMLEFLRDAEWIIHNAAFDIEFLNWELEKEGGPRCEALYSRVIDTLSLAREAHPGKRNNLDALCERFGVSNAHRTLHGALLDAELLAEVYIEMIGGRQASLILVEAGRAPLAAGGKAIAVQQRPIALPPRLSDAELEAHAAFIATLGEKAIWREYDARG
jgi:DNA polymerase III subunit epsilon